VRFKGVLVKLGIFTILTAMVTVLLASNIGNFALFRARYPIQAAFNDATGVLAGDPVTLSGVRVGKVSSTKVEHGYAILGLSIDRAVKLPKSTQIEIRYRNLLGLRVVNLDPGDGQPPYLKANDRVPSTQTEGPLDLDTIFNNLRPLLTGLNPSDLNTVSEALIAALAPHKADLDAILGDSSKLLGTLATKDQQLGQLVDSLGTVSSSIADQRAQLQQLLSNLAQLSDTLAGDSGPLDRVLTNLNTATGDLATIVKKNRTSLDRDLGNIATLLELVRKHQADLVQIAGHLDDVQLATLKAMSYGEWVNLFLPAFCIAGSTGCENAVSSSSSSSPAPTTSEPSASASDPTGLGWLLSTTGTAR
jgi:phospholipid/cholesterol/gamma-HCH transport system substrate-binding protein